MNAVDLAIIGVCAISMLVSLFRGFVREVFSVIVWLAALFAALHASSPLAERIAPWIDVPSVRVIAAFSGVFVLVLIIGGLINYLLGKLVESTGLGGTDRMLGALFGLVRGVAIVLAAVLIARFTPFPNDPWWQQSSLLPSFERLAAVTVRRLPEQWRGHMPQNDVVAGPLENGSG